MHGVQATEILQQQTEGGEERSIEVHITHAGHSVTLTLISTIDLIDL